MSGYRVFLVDNSDPDFHEKIKKPLAMWYAPWYHDPAEGKIDAEKHFLSIHYQNDWSDKRPPLCVRCPNGSIWVPDQKSSNGTGWKVTGEAPNISCSPSISVPGYHGFLRDGLFTADLDGNRYGAGL